MHLNYYNISVVQCNDVDCGDGDDDDDDDDDDDESYLLQPVDVEPACLQVTVAPHHHDAHCDGWDTHTHTHTHGDTQTAVPPPPPHLNISADGSVCSPPLSPGGLLRDAAICRLSFPITLQSSFPSITLSLGPGFNNSEETLKSTLKNRISSFANEGACKH